MIEPIFVPFCVEEQNILGTDERVNKFVQIFPEEDRQEAKEIFDRYNSSKDRWNAFVKYVKNKHQVSYNFRKIKMSYERINCNLKLMYFRQIKSGSTIDI